MSIRNCQRGQASVEIVAVLPLVALIALVLWQAAVAGQAVWLVGAAARSAARAQAIGGNPTVAARAVLPASLARAVRVRELRDGGVDVALGVPLVTGRGRLTTVGARARFVDQRGSS